MASSLSSLATVSLLPTKRILTRKHAQQQQQQRQLPGSLHARSRRLRRTDLQQHHHHGMTVTATATTPTSSSPPSPTTRPGLATVSDLDERRDEVELNVKGTLPAWLAGTLLINGPGRFDAGDAGRLKHLFDGYALVAKFRVDAKGRAFESHRYVESDAYKSVRDDGKMRYREFGTGVKKNLVERVGSVVEQIAGSGVTDNSGVSVHRIASGETLTFTETVRGTFVIDPHTLATVRRFSYGDSDIRADLATAHPYIDGEEMINVFTSPAPASYNVCRVHTGSNNKRELIAKVPCQGSTPGWVHSFGVSTNYVIVPDMPIRYNLSALLLDKELKYCAFDWFPEESTIFNVIQRNTGHVKQVKAPPFFVFHFINAFERGDDQVCIDACLYDDPEIVASLTLENLEAFPGVDLPQSRVVRITLPLREGNRAICETVVEPSAHGFFTDLPTINPAYSGQPYRYAYTTAAKRPTNVNNALAKMDLDAGTAVTWHEEGCTVQEPYYVAKPGASGEDDGVVLSVVNDDKGDGFLLVLDARSFKEVARAHLPGGMPYHFHGTFLPSQ